MGVTSPEISAAASAVAAVSAATGVVFGPTPPTDVLVYACLGGLVAVWLQHRDVDVVITPRWLMGTLLLFAVSVGSGIVLSAGLLSLAHAGAAGLAWLAPVPHWVAAAVLAGTVHWLAPLAYGILRRRSASSGGGAP